MDNVNHPQHYEGATSFECIETMLIAFGVEYTQVFCVLISYKYMWRYELKNGKEDLEKAGWYLDKYFGIAVEYDSNPCYLEDKVIVLQNLLNEKKEKLNGSN